MAVLFLAEEAAAGVNRWPDHLPVGEPLASKAPVTGVRAADVQAFCAWLTRREGGSWQRFRPPQSGETQAAGCWVINGERHECRPPPGTPPLISAAELRDRYYGDLARALESYRSYSPLSPTRDPAREEVLRKELASSGLQITLVSDFAAVVAGSCFDFSGEPTLAGGVSRALEYNLSLEQAWDQELLRQHQAMDAAAFANGRDADLCPDLQLSAGEFQWLDLGEVIANLRRVTDDFSFRADRRDKSGVERYARRLAEHIDRSLSCACTPLDARAPPSARAALADRADLDAMVRWHARLCAVIAAGLVLRRTPLDPGGERRVSAYRALYVALAIVEARVAGVTCPHEAIMIVRQRG